VGADADFTVVDLDIEREVRWQDLQSFAPFLDAALRPAQDGGGSRPGGLMLNPGDQAPEFTGRDHRGNAVKLSDFRGKTVVLWFYPKADTPG
jgi:peroxiredoxin Q/BCP